MAKPTKVTMTFAVTFTDVKGISIAAMRAYIWEALNQTKVTDIAAGASFDKDKLKIHLTNKETSYA